MSSKPEPSNWFFVYVGGLYGFAFVGVIATLLVIATGIKAAFQ